MTMHQPRKAQLREILAHAADRIESLTAQNHTLRRIIAVLCALGLFLIAYSLLREPLLSLAMTFILGGPIADWGMA